jgi:hypothetical protein
MREAGEILQAPDTFATSALLILLDKYGMEVMEWDPVTLSLEIKSGFGFEPSHDLLDRINAASVLYTSNLFQLSLETFNAVCNSLNFGSVTSETFLPADLDDVLWGVTEARILLGDTFEETPFSHNIARYVGMLLSEDGIHEAPSVLAFAEYPEEQSMTDEGLEDDPEAFEMYWQDQKAENENLERLNNVKIFALFRQVEELPLKRGSTDFVREAFRNLQEDSPELAASLPRQGASYEPPSVDDPLLGQL